MDKDLIDIANQVHQARLGLEWMNMMAWKLIKYMSVLIGFILFSMVVLHYS